MPASRFAAWAGARTEVGVTRVPRVTDAPNPVICAGSGNVAEATRAAGPRVTGVTTTSLSGEEVTWITQHPMSGLTRRPTDNQHGNLGNPGNPKNRRAPTSPKVPADSRWYWDLLAKRTAVHEFVGLTGPLDVVGLTEAISKEAAKAEVAPNLERGDTVSSSCC
jgi:hypothetical protein